MIVTNKRIKSPKEIEVSNGILVKVVDQFKLLGINIDNKLNFASYGAQIKKKCKYKTIQHQEIILFMSSS